MESTWRIKTSITHKLSPSPQSGKLIQSCGPSPVPSATRLCRPWKPRRSSVWPLLCLRAAVGCCPRDRDLHPGTEAVLGGQTGVGWTGALRAASSLATHRLRDLGQSPLPLCLARERALPTVTCWFTDCPGIHQEKGAQGCEPGL